ncbi:MAG TPA: response regulator, partial [Actinomycetales bacterium]
DVAEPAEALRLLAAGATFDAAILDMHMPQMDGAQLARALRALPTGRDLPLLLLTSLQSRLEADDRARFVATITKPARTAVLHEKLLLAVAPVEAVLAQVEASGGRRELDPPAVDVPAATGAPAQGSPTLRILLAEDNLVNQKVTEMMLARHGHRIDIVGNGLEALEAVQRFGYDLVLMDMRMPELDGLQATRQIRSQVPSERQPLIVALTANALSEDQAACREAGMDHFLSKPIRAGELAAVLSLVDAGPARPARPTG